MLKTAPPELQEVLLLRQQLAKSSVKKYQAMEKAVCADGRARGMFQFYAKITRFMTGAITGNNLIWSLTSNSLRDLQTLFTYSAVKDPARVMREIGAAYLNKFRSAIRANRRLFDRIAVFEGLGTAQYFGNYLVAPSDEHAAGLLDLLA